MRLFVLMLLLITLVPVGSTLAQDRPDAPPYAHHGPYPVGVRDVQIANEDRPLDATIWYPALNPDNAPELTTYRWQVVEISGQALRDAAPANEAGPFPLVVFSHGHSGFRFQSVFYTEHLASHGFVVIAVDHPGNTLMDFEPDLVTVIAERPLDILRVITYAETKLSTLVDIERIAVTGHSLGGLTALAVAGAQMHSDALIDTCAAEYPDCLNKLAALRGLNDVPDGLWPPTSDPRIDAVVALAPYGGTAFESTGIAALTAPTMIIVGTADDTAPPPEHAYPLYDGLGSSTRVLVELDNAGHNIFVVKCIDLAFQFDMFTRCSDPVWDMGRAHDLTNHFATAFFLATFYEDADAAAAIPSADFIGVSVVEE